MASVREDYRPVPFVDTDGLTRSEWLEYRKHGIGASDLPVLMELSEHKSPLALFEEKASRRPVELLNHEVRRRKRSERGRGKCKNLVYQDMFSEPIIDPDAPFNLSAEAGHVLEPVIAKHLSTQLGFPVYRDTMLYRHPEYPFLLVDLDFVMMAAHPRTGELRLVIVECKTASWWKKEDWEDGVPRAYEMQVRQAMCVMNIDEAIVICLYDNNEGGVATYRVTRDYDVEAEIIQLAKDFWCEHVEKNILPTPYIPTKAAKREIAEYARRQEKWKPLPQLFELGLSELIAQYDAAKADFDEQKARYDAAKETLDAIELQFSAHMLNHDEAACGDLKLRWKQRSTRSVDYDAFRLAYPQLYAKFVKERVSLGFEVKPMKRKKSEEKEAA